MPRQLKNVPFFKVWGTAPAPPTLPVFGVVLLLTELKVWRLFGGSVCFFYSLYLVVFLMLLFVEHLPKELMLEMIWFIKMWPDWQMKAYFSWSKEIYFGISCTIHIENMSPFSKINKLFKTLKISVFHMYIPGAAS